MRKSINEWYREKIKTIDKMILHESDEQIMGTSIDEMCSYYYDQYKVEPAILIEEEIHSEYDKGVERIPAERREEFYRQEGDIDYPYENINVIIPIKYNENILDISKHSSNPGFVNQIEDDYIWHPREISFSFRIKGYLLNLSEEQVKQRIEKSKEELKRLLEYKNSNILDQNTTLKQSIKGSLIKRRGDIKDSEDRISSLKETIDIPLTLKESVKNDIVSLKENPIVEVIKPSPEKQKEYSLDRNQFIHLISYFDNQAKSFGRTPETFCKMEEEGLRNILLSNLNSIFQGKATGETFSKKGKTDIYLNIDKGEILIFECKFWKGEKVFNQTIDQIRSYLTWRENYAVITFFVKQKNFINILEKIPGIIQKHNSYISNYKKIEASHFLSRNQTDDSGKEVEIHYLFYNLYSE